MALTREFKETVRTRVQNDPAFREALLKEAVESMLQGDVATGKAILRDYINATEGFSELEAATQKSAKSLMRMLGPKGNPQAENVFLILASLQKALGIRLHVQSDVRRRKLGSRRSKAR